MSGLFQKLKFALILLSLTTFNVFAEELSEVVVLPNLEQQSVYSTNENFRILQAATSSLRNTVDALSFTRAIVWFISGDAETGTNVSARVTVPFDGTITNCIAYAKTAPTGSALIYDINLDGSTIWSTQANRVQIAASANEGTQTSFNTTSVSDGDVFTIDIDQIGSSTAGADQTVILYIEEDL